MFDPVTYICGTAAPLKIANIDTDVIIRIERLTTGDSSQIGHYAFEALRYRPDGTQNPDFILNEPRYCGAPILLAGPNFGCGSSREAAVNALLAMGIRCVVADGFGDIFYANCFQNGLLPIRLPEADVLALMEEARAVEGGFTVNLNAQTVETPMGRVVTFAIDEQRKEALLAGLDDIGLTLRDMSTIAQWQAADRAARPWIWNLEDVA
jgi:3-isopropylmalate/(R)-2-methylmalate dehydratase small subunit